MVALAFRAHPAVTKALLVADMRAHREADRLVPGIYWHNRRGCAVGCSVHTINCVTRRRIKHGDHTKLAMMTGIPEQLLHLQDRLFESLPSERRVLWPEQFYAAIPDGADLSDVWPRFAVWLLRDFVLPAQSDQRVAAAIGRVVSGYETGWTNDTAHDAAAYAYDATYAAYAYDATYAAYACAAAYAYDAAYAAYAAKACSYAANVSPYAAAVEQMADKLLQLLAEAPVPAAETPA